MTPLELIVEMKRRYPVGSVVKLLKGHNGKSIEYVISDNTYDKCAEYPHGTSERISFMTCAGYFYYRGEWAEVIKSPDLIESYQIY